MDEIVDGVVLGQGVNGTLYGSPVLTSDSRDSMAMYFNGTFQAMSVPNPTDVCIGNPEYCPNGHTLMMWIKGGKEMTVHPQQLISFSTVVPMLNQVRLLIKA